MIDGNVRSFADMKIDGNIKGNVETTKNITINGKVVGDLTCDNISMKIRLYRVMYALKDRL